MSDGTIDVCEPAAVSRKGATPPANAGGGPDAAIMKVPDPRTVLQAAAALLLAGTVAAPAGWTLDRMIDRDAGGRPVFRHRELPADLRNPVSAADERAFQERARHIIARQSEHKVAAGNTYFENEKRTYGYLMAQALGKRGLEAVADLQLEDAQAGEWHRQTNGIDYYACFTLKHQMRKYFYFGDLLDPAYRQRMFDGAKRWTEQDPLRRPHPAFRAPGESWGPDAKNSWVDVRTTENLFLMRVSSVYLMAEETGNRATAASYKRQILDYAATLYRVGIGEWDSENYHGHSLAPLANLLDFAKDPEVKRAAKACLDWFCAAGAVKYFRGGFNGPTKRDYNHPQPFGGSAANMLWVLFGDSPRPNEHWESDEVHLITSGYRPPPAVLALARKRFAKPLELFASKPAYTATTTFQKNSRPQYLETQYFAHSFQLGSLAGGTRPGAEDVNGFKVLVFDEDQGAVALQAVPGPDPAFPGSPKYQPGKVSGENRVAQFGNLAIWLVRDGSSPWLWVVPESVKVSTERNLTFLECDRTWLALHPLGAGRFERDEALGARIAGGEAPPFPRHQVLATRGDGRQPFCGFAVEVGERQSHGSFEAFKRAAAGARVDRSRLADGAAEYRAADGRTLAIRWHDDPRGLGVLRDGRPHDWDRHAGFLYQSAGAADDSPIAAPWGGGELRVSAGGTRFRCTVGDDGKVGFENS